ncbi:MAG: tetratricopeptide repeat protein [Alloprevotella sp.]|nr:tetratricopeptide repeat protein [Alloprevotella sp.]
MRHLPKILLSLIAALCLLSACSTKKNTATSRFWHSFTARFNTYYNGHEAYKAGVEDKERSNQDNFTELLPFFIVGNEKSAETGKQNFEIAITKAEKAIHLHSIKKKPKVSAGQKRTEKVRQMLAKKEYNPFLRHAWLLMGKAQFQSGQFVEAASTFSYITRHYAAEPVVASEARIWLARCYSQLKWYYDAEDVMNRLSRDSIPRRLERERDGTTADLLIRQQRFSDALPYLRRAARREPRKLQKARLYFLLGQVEQQLGHNEEAYKAYGKCLRKNPPYRMELNARIMQTEVLSSDAGKKKVSILKRMAKSDNNKEYLDQIYYALGNVHLAAGDTAMAIDAYEKGRKESKNAGIEKGVLLLRLGEVYWAQQRYDKAQTCYGEAIGLIDKEHKAYEETKRRSKVLDQLVPFTNTIHLQDSLQWLAGLSEDERNAAIDRVIEALKKSEKEQERLRKDSILKARRAERGEGGGEAAQEKPQSRITHSSERSTWYFYDPASVGRGRTDFQRRWGKRANEDNWRRSNKTVMQMDPSEGYDYDAEDSIKAAEDSIAALEEKNDTTLAASKDPHKREFYLKDIPFTPEAKAASDLLIMDALYNAGIIEKDDLEDFPLADATLSRLTGKYPEFEKLEDAYYQRFLLYMRWGKPDKADLMRQHMASLFPDSTRTKLILDPEYLENARFARSREDSLYAATYDAYRRHDLSSVHHNYDVSTEKYPNGANRPKFIFVNLLSNIGIVDNKELANQLRELVKKYPKSDVSELAGMIVNGLDAGRVPGSASFDLGSLWSRRIQSDSLATPSGEPAVLLPDRKTPFALLIAFHKDSINDNELLYNIAHYNFTGYYLRKFELEKLTDAEMGLTQFRIHGFNSFDEAHAYTQDIYKEKPLADLLRHTRLFLISEHNMQLVGRQFSFAEYQQFYDSIFAPVPPPPALRLDNEAEQPQQQYEDKLQPIYPLETKDKDEEKPAENAEDKPAAPTEKPADEEIPAEDGETFDVDETYPAEEVTQAQEVTETEEVNAQAEEVNVPAEEVNAQAEENVSQPEPDMEVPATDDVQAAEDDGYDIVIPADAPAVEEQTTGEEYIEVEPAKKPASDEPEYVEEVVNPLLPANKQATPQDDYEYYDEQEPSTKPAQPTNTEPIYEDYSSPAQKSNAEPATSDDWYSE